MDIISEIIEKANQEQITKNNTRKKLIIKLRVKSTSDSQKELIQNYIDICDDIDNLEQAFEFNNICLLYIPNQKMKQHNNKLYAKIKILRINRNKLFNLL